MGRGERRPATTAGAIDLQLPGVSAIVSVKYIDSDGAEQTLAPTALSLTASSFAGWLFPAYGERWPSACCTPGSVRVRFIAGYGDTAADVPEDIKLWMVAHAAQLLNSPDGLTDGSFQPSPFLEGLLDAHKVWRAS